MNLKPLNSIVVFSKTFRISWRQKPIRRDDISGKKKAWGVYDPETSTIPLYSKLSIADKRKTLLHELVHAVDDEVGLHLSEDKTEHVASALDDTFFRNGMWSRTFMARLDRGGK